MKWKIYMFNFQHIHPFINITCNNKKLHYCSHVRLNPTLEHFSNFWQLIQTNNILVNNFCWHIILVNNRAKAISQEANFHWHLVPHPSQERKLDKERGDILTWEPEHKKRRTTWHKPKKKNIVKNIVCVKREEPKRQIWYDLIVQTGKNKMYQLVLSLEGKSKGKKGNMKW